MGAREPAADPDVLHGLQEDGDAGNCRKPRTQPLDDLIGVCGALVERFELNVYAAGIQAGAAGAADRGAERRDVGILRYHLRHRLHALAHSRKGYVRIGLSEAKQQSGIFLREKALRHRVEHPARNHDEQQV